MNRQSKALSPEQADALGRELDALRREVVEDLGERDLAHIRGVIRLAHGSEAAGRVLLHFGWGPLSFAVGTTALALSKILENMEIGHNVMHGQYDWTRDPGLDGRQYEWDTVCPGDDWRHSHNYEHHTFTNILGKDRDIGYGVSARGARAAVAPRAPDPARRAALLALFFQWGVGSTTCALIEVATGQTASLGDFARRARPFVRKAAWQLFKDYVLLPGCSPARSPRRHRGERCWPTARNLWTFAIIFCGHFPRACASTPRTRPRTRPAASGTRGSSSARPTSRAAAGFHLLTGNLSHQIEHHLFPDLPAARYPEMAPRVRAICERYGQTYNTGSFRRQLGSVVGRILRLSLPGPGVRARPAASPPEPAVVFVGGAADKHHAAA
jgi:fatty acid desaturase